MALPTMRDLAAFVAPPPDPRLKQDAMNDLANSIRMRTEREIQDRQFNTDQANAMARHADTHGENVRSNMATEADWAVQREAAARTAREKVIAAIREAAVKGAPPEVLRAMAAEAKAQGLDITEEMTEPAPQKPPTELAAFEGQRMGFMRPTDVEAPPPPEQPKPTGRFNVRGPQGPMGTIDQPGIAEGQQRAAAPALAAFEGMGTGIDRHAYRGGADAARTLPGLSPAEALEAAGKASKQSAADANANARAAMQRQAMSESKGASQGRLNDSFVDRVYARTLDKAKVMHDSKAIQQRIMDSERSEQLIKISGGLGKTSDPNALAGRVALGQLVKATAGARYSDADLNLFMKSGGKEAQIETYINTWMNGGQISASQLRMIQGLAQRGKKAAMAEQLQLAQSASNGVRNHPMIRRYAGPEMQELLAEQAAQEVLGYGADPGAVPPAADDGSGSVRSARSESRAVAGPAAAQTVGEDEEWDAPEPATGY